LKLVLVPIFEANFRPCSYGYRPNHRVHDAVAEVRHFTSHSYEWIVEGDIRACYDEISHPALLDRVRARIADKRVLAVVAWTSTADYLAVHVGLDAPGKAAGEHAHARPLRQVEQLVPEQL